MAYKCPKKKRLKEKQCEWPVSATNKRSGKLCVPYTKMHCEFERAQKADARIRNSNSRR